MLISVAVNISCYRMNDQYGTKFVNKANARWCIGASNRALLQHVSWFNEWHALFRGTEGQVDNVAYILLLN